MKNTIKKVVCSAIAMVMAFSIVACGPSVVEDVDKNKTVVYVANYNGGVGEKWVDEAEKRFEAKVAEISYEAGKKGVDIVVTHDKNYNGVSLKLETDMNYIYCTQSIDYFGKYSNMMDISDVVNQTGEDGKSIFSKLNDHMKEALKINDKYYGIPAAEWYPSMNYDEGVFKKYGLYFSDQIDTDGCRKFIEDDGEKLSCGSDGKYGTADDGLPSSIEEFKKLIGQMKANNVIPFTWAGGHDHYSNMLSLSILANLLGASGTNVFSNINSNGEKIEYISSWDGDEFEVDSAVLTEENAYLVKQSTALYHAIDFANYVFSDGLNYLRNATDTHIQGQENFVLSGRNAGKPDIGIIIEGTYWYNEANEAGTFDMLDSFPHIKAYKNPKIMPLPVQAEDTVTENNGKKSTLISSGDYLIFMNKNTPSTAVQASKDFIAFLYTDEELLNFTRVTGMHRGVEYDYSSIVSDLNDYSKSVLDLRLASDVQYATSSNPIFIRNRKNLQLISTASFFSSRGYTQPFMAFTNGVSVMDYFTGIAISETDWKNNYLK